MPNQISSTQLDSYQTMVSQGRYQDFYQAMSDNGYRYADWAMGVARGDTITGSAALDYLKGTALMGMGGDDCRNLSQERIDSIRESMAQGYLDTLKTIARDNNGVVDRDVSYQETSRFHEKAFQDNGLGIDNWTLKTPMDIIRDKYGDQEVEDRWARIRDTGGTGIDGLAESTGLMTEVGKALSSPDAETREKASDWIDKAPGTANWDAIGRTIKALWDAVNNTKLPWLDDYFKNPWDEMLPGVNEGENICYRNAKNWRQPVDPLMLDLDGDGLELKRADGSVLFDHNSDTIKTGTGWIGADDGILVRDLNGDGQITSGMELFGMDTLKLNGQKAANGFDALADLDSNHDGNFTSADLAWSSVKVWRDLDQDGVSDAGELFTLDQLGISRIGVVGSATDATGGTQAGTTVNGNVIAQSASFTQTTNGVTAEHTVGSVDLEANAFYREFTVDVPVSAAVEALPDMQGSGRARDLDEAATLSPLLAMSLSAFSQASTRDAQMALVDNLITQWAQSSDYWSSIEDNLGGADNINLSITNPAGMTMEQFRNLIGVLEVFNGERFYEPPRQTSSGTTSTKVKRSCYRETVSRSPRTNAHS